MKNEKEDLLTSGSIAKSLGISDVKIKKLIKELGIQPKTKKGICNYYSPDELTKIKKVLK